MSFPITLVSELLYYKLVSFPKMVILESIKIIHCSSQYFGVAPYKIKKFNGKYYFCESRFLKIYSIFLIILYSIGGVICGIGFIKETKRYSLWANVNLSLDALTAILNCFTSPIIFFKYRKNIYKNLNRCEEVHSILSKLHGKKVESRYLKIANNMALLGYYLLTSCAIAFAMMPDFLEFFYESNKILYLVLAISVYGIHNSAVIQFFAYVNIIRFMYVNINQILILHHNKKLKWETLQFIIKADDFLKDFLNDLSGTFSLCLILEVFQTFISIVDEAFLFVTDNKAVDQRFLESFMYVVAYYSYFTVITTTVCLFVIEEVI